MALEKYRTVADFTYDWEYLINEDGFFNYMSPSCERITGFTSIEFINDPKLLNRIIFYADIEMWEKYILEAHTCRQVEMNQEFSFRIITKKGDLRWICCVCQNMYVDGMYLGVRVSNRDITSNIKAQYELLILIINMEERERNRFSRDLLDGLGPILLTVKLYFKWLAESNDTQNGKNNY